jgi:hypothetical protein
LKGRILQGVDIDNPVRIHVFYFTAWAGEEGQTHFRDDVYSLDQDLIAAIEQLPPYPEQPLRIDIPPGWQQSAKLKIPEMSDPLKC